MATEDLNVERLMVKMTLSTAPSIPWHISGKSASVASARSEVLTKRAGCPVSHADSGKWLDEGTVPHRVGVPDPNVPLLMKNCLSGYIPPEDEDENIGDYSNNTCNGGKADFLTLHGPVASFACSGDTGSTPPTTLLICQASSR